MEDHLNRVVRLLLVQDDELQSNGIDPRLAHADDNAHDDGSSSPMTVTDNFV